MKRLIAFILLVPALAFGLDIDLDNNTAVDVAYGGTNATTAPQALTNLGAAAASHNHSGVYDPAGTASTAVSNHAAASDPHTGYMLESNIGTGANNYLKLGASPGSPSGSKYLRDDMTWAAASSSDTIGWDYTARSAAPTGGDLIAGKIYRANNEGGGWDPISYTGTTDYFVLYTGSTYVGIVDIDGNLLLTGLPKLSSAAYAATTSAELAGVTSDETGSGALVFANTPTLVTPVIGAATGTSLMATGRVDGTVDVVISTAGSPTTISSTDNKSCYYMNQGNSAANSIFTLPTAAAGLQYCTKNYTGITQVLKFQTSASGQYIDLDGVLTASGGLIK